MFAPKVQMPDEGHECSNLAEADLTIRIEDDSVPPASDTGLEVEQPDGLRDYRRGCNHLVGQFDALEIHE